MYQYLYLKYISKVFYPALDLMKSCLDIGLSFDLFKSTC